MKPQPFPSPQKQILTHTENFTTLYGNNLTTAIFRDFPPDVSPPPVLFSTSNSTHVSDMSMLNSIHKTLDTNDYQVAVRVARAPLKIW